MNATSSVLEPNVLINSPTDIEKVWNQQMGFMIHSYNLKAVLSNTLSSHIEFHVTKYLEHGYIFHLKEQKVVRVFTQEDVDEQFIVVLLKHSSNIQDYFTFQVAVNKTIFRKEYRFVY